MKNKKILIGIVILLVAVIGGYCVYSMTREKTKEEQLNEFFSKPPSAYQNMSKEEIAAREEERKRMMEKYLGTGKSRSDDR